MNSKTMWIAILGVGIAAAAFAGLRTTGANVVPEPAANPAPPAPQDPALPPGHPQVGGGSTMPGLPPGHPPMPQGSAAANMPAPTAAAEDGPNLSWTVPARWKEAPNPSSMRIATYKIPKAGSDAEDAEMSVTRAGGGTAANADRWVGQFDEAGQKTAKKTERTSGGFKTTLVEVEGTFASGGMMGGPATPKTGWALLGAIVETPGTAHFFKLTGPAATVKGARPEVDALLASLKEKR